MSLTIGLFPRDPLAELFAKLTDVFIGTEDIRVIPDINTGHCFNWAFTAYLLLPDRVNLHIDQRPSYHAFISIGERFYDAECIYGSEAVAQLPIYRTFGEPDDGTKQIAVDEFKNYWDELNIKLCYRYAERIYALGLVLPVLEGVSSEA